MRLTPEIPALARIPSFRALLVIGLAWLAACSGARAQYEVSVKLNKSTFITCEGVEATITITNHSGTDVVLGGPSGDSWLAFNIVDPHGQQVPSVKLRTEETIVFQAGKTISRVVNLGEFYSFSDYGTYSIAASVYHPPTQQYYESLKTRATFTDARPFIEPKFGVPAGQPGAGEVHVYSLAVLRDQSGPTMQRNYLYLRILDDATKVKLNTFSMGTIIEVADPQVTLDRGNRLHVLFMTMPHVYAHWCVDTQGRVVKREYFKEIEANRPHLGVGKDENVEIQGGVPWDPNAPIPKAPGRSVGKRPPGF